MIIGLPFQEDPRVLRHGIGHDGYGLQCYYQQPEVRMEAIEEYMEPLFLVIWLHIGLESLLPCCEGRDPLVGLFLGRQVRLIGIRPS